MRAKIVGKYELIEPLGSGATAEVYLACDTVLNRQVSLKILKPALVADPGAFERFGREAQAAAALFHPNIATVLDMGDADGRYFIAMRYIPGQSLDKYIAEHGPLSWDGAVRLARQMGAALDYAHEQGFLHRDVKPSNIIRSPKGDYVLTDFGLQRAMLSTGFTTYTGVVLGTPPYIAPEVWDGKPAVAATDQYALACVIYEALTAQVLFAGDTPMAVLKRHSDGWLPPAKWPQGAPHGLDPVFGRALAQKPEDRFHTMDALAAALEASANAAPAIPQSARPGNTGAAAQPPKYREGSSRKKSPSSAEVRSVPADVTTTSPTLPRNWKTIVVGLAVFLILIGALILAVRQPRAIRASTEAPTAMQARAVLEAPTVTATATTAPTSTPALGIGSSWTRPADGMKMMYVPEGNFIMGSPAKVGQPDEHPQHTVYLDAFWMDATEVTNKMYALCVATGACKPPQQSRSYSHQSYYGNAQYNDYPVIYVDWNQASSYCGWAASRLPTEAEWEKAARGTDGRTYPWGEGIDSSFANILLGRDSEIDPTAVGRYPSGVSPYGLYDMVGNVYEWVADWYDGNYYAGSPASNPQGPPAGKFRVVRGGMIDWLEPTARAEGRSWTRPESAWWIGRWSWKAHGSGFEVVGFRCARSP